MPGAMGALADVVEDLCRFEQRGSCTDAERRAAVWLHDDLRERGHEAWVETVWVRPQWWTSLAAHAVLGLAASLVAATAQVVVQPHRRPALGVRTRAAPLEAAQVLHHVGERSHRGAHLRA